MEAVFGARPYDAGQIFLNGDEVHFKNPMQAIKSGIALVPEDRKKQGLVLGNSVAFNLTLSSLRFCMNGIAVSEKSVIRLLNIIVKDLGLKQLLRRLKQVVFRVEINRRLYLENGLQQSRMS